MKVVQLSANANSKIWRLVTISSAGMSPFAIHCASEYLSAAMRKATKIQTKSKYNERKKKSTILKYKKSGEETGE